MIQYLIILLDDTATSYCHYDNQLKKVNLIPLNTLHEGIRFAMKENMTIQFVYPAYELPQVYQKTIKTIDHINIKPSGFAKTDADVVVFNNCLEMDDYHFQNESTYVLRISKADLFDNYATISESFNKTNRLNVVLTDVETFTENDLQTYKIIMNAWVDRLDEVYISGYFPQVNLLTDRMLLDKMNSCGAGDSNITLAPDGKFYVCPAFYVTEGGYSIGDIENGLDIKNPQLYRLSHAPLCRICDAYQCKRCIWLNRRTTLEVNTPSHEQCVMAHIERNASRELLNRIKKQGFQVSTSIDIKEINYLDPFEIKEEW